MGDKAAAKQARVQRPSTSGSGTYGSDWLTVVSLPQQDLLSSLGTGALLTPPLPRRRGQAGSAATARRSSARCSARPSRCRAVGQRHAAADQPDLGADDRRQGLHRRGPAERAVRRGRAHVLMTAEALAISSKGLTKRFRGAAGGRPDRPGGAAGRGLRLPRPERLGQDHHDPHAARPGLPDQRYRGAAWRAGAGRHISVLSRVGSLVEGPAFYPYLSGWDNLARYDAADRSASPKSGGARIGQALDRVGLTAAARKRYRNYSLGMKQRLAWPRRCCGPAT